MMKWTALAIALLLQARVAHAEDIERARRLFAEATELREAGLYADAVERLKQAISIKDTPGLEYHAGFCEAKLGHYRSAVRYYERAAALLRDGTPAPDVVSLLPLAHAAALEHVAKLRLYVSGGSAPMHLKLDSEPEQLIPVGDLLLDPGNHRLVLSSTGYRPETRVVTVNEGEVLNLHVNLTETGNASANASPVTSPFPWKTVSVGVGLGVTAAALGIGIYSAVKRDEAQDSINFYREKSPKSAGEANAANDKSLATRWETIGFISAGAGAAATVAILVLWPTSKRAPLSALCVGPRMVNVTLDF